MPIEIS